MKKLINSFRKWWLFTFENPVVRKGESSDGAFKWVFRRYWLEITTLSENFTCRFTADEHPYGYLLSGKGDENIIGFAQTLYTIGKVVTTDQTFVGDISKAFKKYNDRIQKAAAQKVVEDAFEEKVAVEEVKQIYEKVEQVRDPKTGRFVKRK